MDDVLFGFVLCLTVVEVHAKEYLSEKDVKMFLIDGMGYYELEFTRTNLTPGLAYGATKFMPDDVILGFSRYGDHDLLVAHIDVETNKGNLIDTEIDFGYPLNLPGT